MHRLKLIYPNYQALFRHLQQYQSVPGSMAESLALLLEPMTYNSRELLLKPQQICDRSWFLWKGTVRWYTITAGKETTLWITQEGQIILLSEYLTHSINALLYLQAIEPCETLTLRYSELQKLYDAHPETQNISAKIVAQHNKHLQDYALAMRMTKAEGRIRWLIGHIGNDIYRIEANYLASFVNMDESTFYKVRKKMETE